MIFLLFFRFKPITIFLAGTPPHISQDGISFVTTDPAATILPLPIVTPLIMIAAVPIHTSSSIIVIPLSPRSPLHIVLPGVENVWSWQPHKTYTTCHQNNYSQNTHWKLHCSNHRIAHYVLSVHPYSVQSPCLSLLVQNPHISPMDNVYETYTTYVTD